jgi:hypothetical protein
MLRIHRVVPFLALAACGAVEPVYVDAGDDDLVDAVVEVDATPSTDATVENDATDAAPATDAGPIDMTPPVVTITGGPTGPVDDTTPTFTFTVTGDPTLIECAIDLGGYAACASPYTTVGLSQGAHAVHVRARDAAGNLSQVVSRAFTVDTLSPTVTITGGPAEDELYLDDRVTFSFVATDATTLTRECRIYRVGTIAPAYAACTSPRTFDVGGGSTIVQLRFQVRATDAAANSTTVTRTFRQAVPAG